MGKQQELRQSLFEFAAKTGPLQTLLAEVKSVDESAKTCVLVDEDGNDLPNVRLRCVLTGNKSETIYPVNETYVLAARVEDSEDWVIIAADSFYKKTITVGTTEYEITAAGHSIAKGNNTLKGVLTSIVEAVQQIAVIYGNNPDYIKLADALTDINDLLY